MPKKGKRELVLEMEGNKINVKELEKIIQKEIKANGIKFSQDVTTYINTNEQIAYCVCGEDTIKIKL